MGTVGPTITSGVQDISALLPLLGTEQCEEHINSALAKGYLYAAATPLSIFGSLGIARAGFKTLVAAYEIPKWKICGAKVLADMGFKSEGTNLDLLMVPEDSQNDEYLVERRLSRLLHRHDIYGLRGIQISCHSAKWNTMMMLSTFVSCLISISPYVYVNTNGDSTLALQTRWTFPLLRALGGFLTTTMIQFVTQTRVMTIIKKRLTHDLEKNDTLDSQQGSGAVPNSFIGWCWLILLLGGILAVIVGYIGCFSIVQSSRNSAGPLSWLCIEAGLSVIRIFTWGLNPGWDDAPSLELLLPGEHPESVMPPNKLVISWNFECVICPESLLTRLLGT